MMISLIDLVFCNWMCACRAVTWNCQTSRCRKPLIFLSIDLSVFLNLGFLPPRPACESWDQVSGLRLPAKNHVTRSLFLDPSPFKYVNLQATSLFISLHSSPPAKKRMGRLLGFLLCLSSFFISATFADWNILNQRTKSGLKISLKSYCEGWRINVELHNIQGFAVVPEECVSYIGKYVTSIQYKVDSERTIEECRLYLSTSCPLKKDGKDAWLFDIDDTLLSTVPYFKKHHFGGEKLNLTLLEGWMSRGKAPALEHSLRFFDELKSMGVQIFLVSSRREHLRSATTDNLVDVGYHGWTRLILRGADDELNEVQQYKANVRKQLICNGYRIWGIVGDQYSSFEGLPSVRRSFKLPNPFYYVS